jgi:hypothetical protein
MCLHSEEKYGIRARQNATAYAGYDHLVFAIQFPVYVEVLDSISVLSGKVHLAVDGQIKCAFRTFSL